MLQDVYLYLLRRRARPRGERLEAASAKHDFTLLERGVSQRQIHELTGVDRKMIRRYQALFEAKGATCAISSTVALAGMTEPVGA